MGILKPLIFFGWLLLGTSCADAQSIITHDTDSNISAQPFKEYLDENNIRHTVIAVPLNVWAPAIKFEERINERFTAGFTLKGRFINFCGGHVEPFVRYYFSKEAPKGFFIQAKVSVGVYHTRDLNATLWDVSYTPDPQLPYEFFETYGGGATVGYQFILGDLKHFSLELFGGVQYIYSNLPMGNAFMVQKWAIEMPLDVGMRMGGVF